MTQAASVALLFLPYLVLEKGVNGECPQSWEDAGEKQSPDPKCQLVAELNKCNSRAKQELHTSAYIYSIYNI